MATQKLYPHGEALSSSSIGELRIRDPRPPRTGPDFAPPGNRRATGASLHRQEFNMSPGRFRSLQIRLFERRTRQTRLRGPREPILSEVLLVDS